MNRYANEHGAFCIDAIPNQPQVAHCHSFFVHDHARGQGLGKALKVWQCQILRELGFNYATCTTAGDNLRQHAVLRFVGWEVIGRFKNSRTGGETWIWGWEVK